jgi:YfiH family protein
MKQIHSSLVHIVNDNDNFNNPPTSDALITNKVYTPLMVMVADCSPILFYDPKKRVIAVAHAGRAGAFNNIVQNVLKSFTKEFHSNIHDIFVSVGPAICQECYEVGVEIYEQTKELHLQYAIKQKDDKYYLDIRAILYKQLINAGVLQENIEMSKECSSCNTQEYYSYRAEGKTGRFSGVLMLK